MNEEASEWAYLLDVVRRRRAAEVGDAERKAALEKTLTVACRTVPGAVSCSVTQQTQGGRFVTVLTADDRATAVDEAQYTAGDGPCLTAVRQRRLVRIDSMSDEERWPTVGRAAVRLDIHSSLSFPLQAHDQRLRAAINFYGGEKAAFTTERSTAVADLVSKVLAVLLPDEGSVRDEPETERAHWAQQQNALVKRAQQSVMAREGTDAAGAYRILALRSRSGGRALRDVAQDELDGGDRS